MVVLMLTCADLRLATCGFLIAACNTTSAPEVSPNAIRVLFIGNSYLSAHDIPGLVAALGAADSTPIAVSSVNAPNYALIDHWNDGEAGRRLRADAWRYVVLQQGWTPAGVCRDTLRLATTLFAGLAKPIGVQVALFEAWAPATRPDQFPGTIGSYRQAAKDVDGVLLPIAEAWELAMGQHTPVVLYDDSIHPSASGSYYAALVIYARLTQRSPIGLPSSLATASGERVTIPAEVAQELQEHAAAIALTPTPDEIPFAPAVITSRC
jgi:hypothetical protein